MGKKIIIFIFLLLIISSYGEIIFAEVVINEFSSSSSNDDWVELYNNSDTSVDLSSYTLHDGSTNKKNFSCILMPKGFVTLDWNNSLNNTGDLIMLKKGENELVNCVTYGDGGGTKCEGKNEIDLRKPESNEYGARTADGSGGWTIKNTATKDSPNDGSQKNPEAVCSAPTPITSPTDNTLPTETPILTTSITDTPPTPNPTPQYYDNIFLSEVMVEPESGNDEWVELYNGNDFAVNLTDWFIDDIENGGTTPKKFSLSMSGKSYGVIDLSSSIFNNDGDSTRLLDFNQKEKDSFQYQSSEKGKTLGRVNFDSDNFCLQNPSKSTVNNPCLNPTSTAVNPTNTPTPSPSKSPSPTLKTTITKKPTPTTRYIIVNQNSPDLPNAESEDQNENVLGIATQNTSSGDRQIHTLVSSLSFASFSYSLLVILSIFIKIKLRSS